MEMKLYKLLSTMALGGLTFALLHVRMQINLSRL